MYPSEAAEVSRFDRFATTVAQYVAKPYFFIGCLAMVLLWAPSYFLFGNADTWQLLINTATTIVTFLLVALLQNTQARDAKALHHKLNAIADGLADLMESHESTDPSIDHDVEELREAVGLEHREGG